MTWLWAGGAALFAVAAGGVLWTVTRTDYLPRLGAWLVTSVWNVLRSAKGSEEQRKKIREGDPGKDGGR